MAHTAGTVRLFAVHIIETINNPLLSQRNSCPRSGSNASSPVAPTDAKSAPNRYVPHEAQPAPKIALINALTVLPLTPAVVWVRLRTSE